MFFSCFKVTHLQLNPYSLDWVCMFEHFCVPPLEKHLCRSSWGITKESSDPLPEFCIPSALSRQNFLDTTPKISWIKSRNKISVNMLMWRNKHWFGRQLLLKICCKLPLLRGTRSLFSFSHNGVGTSQGTFSSIPLTLLTLICFTNSDRYPPQTLHQLMLIISCQKWDFQSWDTELPVMFLY